MDWASLSKEKKQVLILVSVGVIGSLLALYLFVVDLFLKKRSASAKDFDALDTKIKNAEAVMRGEARLKAEYAESTRDFKHMDDNYIVPVDNPLSWVTEKVYATARRVGVDIQTVAQTGAPAGYWDTAMKSERSVRPYSVRIVAECSYAQLITLIDALEESNPALCVTGIGISPQDGNPAKHVMNMTVEWPMWGHKLHLGVMGINKPPEGV